MNRDAAALAIDVFRRDLLDDARQRAVPPVMGLDVEWDISPGSSRRLQVLQLSSRTQTLVLHLSRMASIPHQLGALLVDPGVGKAGKMIDPLKGSLPPPPPPLPPLDQSASAAMLPLRASAKIAATPLRSPPHSAHTPSYPSLLLPSRSAAAGANAFALARGACGSRDIAGRLPGGAPFAAVVAVAPSPS